MSHPKSQNFNITRRTLLAGTAVGVAATGLSFGLVQKAGAALPGGSTKLETAGGNSLCAAHHKELADHLNTVLNSAYVDERMKNKVLSTTTCPHCRVGISPDRISNQSFAAL